jgi:methionyl-tRNA synthetase
VEGALERLDFTSALASTWRLVGGVNKYVDEQAPWGLAKAGETARLAEVLYSALEACRIVSILVTPFMPSAAAEMQRQLGMGPEDPRDWEAARRWGGLRPGTRPTAPAPIFPRIDLRGDRSPGPSLGVNPSPGPSPKRGGEQEKAAPPAAGAAAVAETITIDDFAKVELRVGKVLAAERVAGADKLLQLRVDLGEEERTVLAGIAQHYAPEALVGRSVVVVANLAPRKIRGVTSHGMLLAADAEGAGVALLSPDKDLPPGSRVR